MIAPADAGRPGILVGPSFNKNTDGNGFAYGSRRTARRSL